MYSLSALHNGETNVYTALHGSCTSRPRALKNVQLCIWEMPFTWGKRTKDKEKGQRTMPSHSFAENAISGTHTGLELRSSKSTPREEGVRGRTGRRLDSGREGAGEVSERDDQAYLGHDSGCKPSGSLALARGGHHCHLSHSPHPAGVTATKPLSDALLAVPRGRLKDRATLHRLRQASCSTQARFPQGTRAEHALELIGEGRPKDGNAPWWGAWLQAWLRRRALVDRLARVGTGY